MNFIENKLREPKDVRCVAARPDAKPHPFTVPLHRGTLADWNAWRCTSDNKMAVPWHLIHFPSVCRRG